MTDAAESDTEQSPASSATLTEQLVPISPLTRWLEGRLPFAGQLTITRVSTGHSHEMFRLDTDSHVWMLRRPPRLAAGKRSHDLAREFRLLRALKDSGIPHASALALCEDSDVIGAPFMIQDFVDGFAPTVPLPTPFAEDPGAARALSFAMIDELVGLAGFDWRGAGLTDFGRPDGFLDRQVDRWLRHLGGSATRTLPYLEDVTGWLRRTRPLNSPVGLMHGDYTWSNVMFSRDRPGRVAALVDWEQATIGDPLLDLGWLLGLWQEDGEPAQGRDPRTLFCQLPGNATRAELLTRYAERSPLSVERIDYYQVLALFKLACVLEASWARYSAGLSDDPTHATFEHRVPTLLTRAARIAGIAE